MCEYMPGPALRAACRQIPHITSHQGLQQGVSYTKEDIPRCVLIPTVLLAMPKDSSRRLPYLLRGGGRGRGESLTTGRVSSICSERILLLACRRNGVNRRDSAVIPAQQILFREAHHLSLAVQENAQASLYQAFKFYQAIKLQSCIMEELMHG